MDDTIYRQAAIDALDVLCQEHRYKIPGKRETYSQYNEAWQDALDRAEGAIFNLPSAQPDCSDCIKHGGDWDCDHIHCHKGKWNERSVFDTEDSGIAEMQSAKCSACGKYHTTPYLYFFDNFNFCPNCGARMEEEHDE